METIKLSATEAAAINTIARAFETRAKQEVDNLTAVLEDGVGGERDILAAATNLRRTLPVRNTTARLKKLIDQMTRDPRAHVEVATKWIEQERLPVDTSDNWHSLVR